MLSAEQVGVDGAGEASALALARWTPACVNGHPKFPTDGQLKCPTLEDFVAVFFRPPPLDLASFIRNDSPSVTTAGTQSYP